MDLKVARLAKASFFDSLANDHGKADDAKIVGRRMTWLAELIERSHPKALLCQECGQPIPIKKVINRENKALCERCYQKLYPTKKATKP